MAMTLHELAEKASLSCETLLEALITPSSLEPEVVRHVMKTISRTKYLDSFAIWKGDPRPASVAILSGLLDSASDVEAFKGIDRAMSALGLSSSLVALPTRYSATLRETTLHMLLQYEQISAVIVLNLSPEEQTVIRYAEAGKPLVLVQSRVNGARSVLLENQKGMAIGMNYLHKRGYRRIALVTASTSGSEPCVSASERLMGYLNSLKRLGREFDESLIVEVATNDEAAGSRAFEALRELKPVPDAVFCAAGDMVAIGCLRAARKAGLSVPGDLAVMGYDDLPVAALVEPSLTTIRERSMIAGAASLVLALEGCVNGPGENLIIMPELVARDSA